MFPNCLKFSDKLAQIVKEKNIDVTYYSVLQSIDKENRKATFINTVNNELSTFNFDFLHLAPPQTCPTFVSNLGAPNGFIDVNIETLRHNAYQNIFALGDAVNLPTAKTAAAIFI